MLNLDRYAPVQFVLNPIKHVCQTKQVSNVDPATGLCENCGDKLELTVYGQLNREDWYDSQNRKSQ